MASIRFEPAGTTAVVPAGRSILEAALLHGVFLRNMCGRSANCATCRVRILSGTEGLSPMGRAEQHRLRELYAAPDTRLACQTRVTGDVVVEVPVPVLGLG